VTNRIIPQDTAALADLAERLLLVRAEEAEDSGRALLEQRSLD
jgi:hypothetical protein